MCWIKHCYVSRLIRGDWYWVHVFLAVISHCASHPLAYGSLLHEFRQCVSNVRVISNSFRINHRCNEDFD